MTAALLLADIVIRGAVLHRDLAEYIVYILFRYLLSGMEYTDIDNEKAYRKKRKQVMSGSMV